MNAIEPTQDEGREQQQSEEHVAGRELSQPTRPLTPEEIQNEFKQLSLDGAAKPEIAFVTQLLKQLPGSELTRVAEMLPDLPEMAEQVSQLPFSADTIRESLDEWRGKQSKIRSEISSLTYAINRLESERDTTQTMQQHIAEFLKNTPESTELCSDGQPLKLSDEIGRLWKHYRDNHYRTISTTRKLFWGKEDVINYRRFRNCLATWSKNYSEQVEQLDQDIAKRATLLDSAKTSLTETTSRKHSFADTLDRTVLGVLTGSTEHSTEITGKQLGEVGNRAAKLLQQLRVVDEVHYSRTILQNDILTDGPRSSTDEASAALATRREERETLLAELTSLQDEHKQAKERLTISDDRQEIDQLISSIDKCERLIHQTQKEYERAVKGEEKAQSYYEKEIANDEMRTAIIGQPQVRSLLVGLLHSSNLDQFGADISEQDLIEFVRCAAATVRHQVHQLVRKWAADTLEPIARKRLAGEETPGFDQEMRSLRTYTAAGGKAVLFSCKAERTAYCTNGERANFEYTDFHDTNLEQNSVGWVESGGVDEAVEMLQSYFGIDIPWPLMTDYHSNGYICIPSSPHRYWQAPCRARWFPMDSDTDLAGLLQALKLFNERAQWSKSVRRGCDQISGFATVTAKVMPEEEA